MKAIQRSPLAFLVVGALLCLATIVVIVRQATGQVPAPWLSITQVDSNRFQITITNSVGYANYEIYRRTFFDSFNPWSLPTTGAQGQYVFNVTNVNSIKLHEFFQAAVGSDWDGDGILNIQDGQPASTNGGLLSITIDSPTSNGTVP